MSSVAATVNLDLALDWRVLGFTTLVSVAAALLFGVAPALSVSRLTPNEVLKEHGRDGGLDRRASLRHASVVLQVALSLALVVGAGLFTRTETGTTCTCPRERVSAPTGSGSCTAWEEAGESPYWCSRP